MVGLTDYASRSYLDNTTGKAAALANASRYLALFSVAGIDAGTGFTELSGTSYARSNIPTASWGSATGSSPATATTTAAVSIPASGASGADWTSGGTAPAIAWGLYDAATVGNLINWDYLGNFSWLPFTVPTASSNFTIPAHGLSVNDPVVITSEFTSGTALPTLSAGAITGVLRVVSVVDANTVTLASGGTFNSSTVLGGGTTLTTSSVGGGMIRKISAQAIPNNTTVTFNSGNLILSNA